MKIKFTYHETVYVTDLRKGTIIAIPLRDGMENPNCFWAPPVRFEPLKADGFVGSLEAGAPVNFFNVAFNPHGNGTHTECIGHIAKGSEYTILKCQREHHLFAKVVTLWPTTLDNGDKCMMRSQLEEVIKANEADALVIRTMPNTPDKMSRQYSGTNPPYFEPAACKYLAEIELEHLLVDLPSLDREEDGGALAAHKAYWRYPEAPRVQATVTEMVYLPDRINDAYYLLNLQVAPFELDAAPSKPILYRLDLFK
jgi:arylformamidase